MKTTLPRATPTALDVGKYCIVKSKNDKAEWCGRVISVDRDPYGVPRVRLLRVGTPQERAVRPPSILAWEDSPEFREWMANDRD